MLNEFSSTSDTSLLFLCVHICMCRSEDNLWAPENPAQIIRHSRKCCHLLNQLASLESWFAVFACFKCRSLSLSLLGWPTSHSESVNILGDDEGKRLENLSIQYTNLPTIFFQMSPFSFNSDILAGQWWHMLSILALRGHRQAATVSLRPSQFTQ